LVRIFSAVHARVPSARFVIAGGGPEEPRIVSALKASRFQEKVTLLGYVPNSQVGQLMAAADVLILPSLEEGFPRRLLEAMACELPFVAASVGGVTEVIGEIARRYTHVPGDAAASADRVVSLLQDESERRAFAEEGLRHVERFDVARVAPVFLSTMLERSGSR
jgi:glycosyltransferase involved in cell wall biosynthesis